MVKGAKKNQRNKKRARSDDEAFDFAEAQNEACDSVEEEHSHREELENYIEDQEKPKVEQGPYKKKALAVIAIQKEKKRLRNKKYREERKKRELLTDGDIKHYVK